MRYGVLADIHGNLPALESTLSALQREGITDYLVAGDLVGYGPFPNECVERIAELDALCVAGNHDLIALGKLSDERCNQLARETLEWTQAILHDDVRNYLNGLPLKIDADQIVVVAHGSLHDPQEYVIRRRQAAIELDRLRAELPEARILILGHTHRASAFDRRQGRIDVSRNVPVPTGQGLCLLNPGAVGQSRDLRPLARFLVLDVDQHRATFHATRYDISRYRQELRRQGLPKGVYHMRPSLPRAIARKVRSRFQ